MTEFTEPQLKVRRCWAFHDPSADGRVLQTAVLTRPPELLCEALGPTVQALAITREQMGEAGAYAYVQDGQLLNAPVRPSPVHAWSWVAKAWMLDAGLADAAARRTRTKLLAACDWTQLPDVPAATAAAWTEYRQALRDVTDQAGYPFAITWPLEPST